MRKPDHCLLQVNEVTLKQAEKFKNLGMAITSEGRLNEKLNTRNGKANASFILFVYLK